MNATQQGISAGQSTRRVANVATHATYEGGKTVATAVNGFFKGFFGTQDNVVQAKPSKLSDRTVDIIDAIVVGISVGL